MKEVFMDGDDTVVDSVGDGAIELSGDEIIIVVTLLSD
jgi:hypothetical protein